MKFIAGKKLSDNKTLRATILWMLFALIVAMSLSIVTKGIEFGFAPDEWIKRVIGNEAEFIEPLGFKDLLLGVHTDLFGLIITFIMIASLYTRTAHSEVVKIGYMILSIATLLIYPIGLLLSGMLGGTGVVLSLGAFTIFHLLAIIASLDLIIAIMRKRY
ncbi:hypothetical protein [Sulfurimonas sp.]|uniref:hypothetical protein n=1 Tax=Sulfurimonas sp. TaxID=2022749 RepID=UPI0025DC9E71|nr:hypothetical protein [Sulfurimonas sp.]MDD5157164.1 hypothetical protein [Sulfurimonas sp.]